MVRLDLTVRDEQATLAPDGWVLLQNARATYGLEAMSRVGLDHIVLVRSIDPNPFHSPQPVPLTEPVPRAHPAGGADSVAGLVLRRRRAAADASR